jgi:hypothetical protein
MTTDVHEAPMEGPADLAPPTPTSPAQAAPAKVTWREKRYQRRRRRMWFEEVLGWILVPVILLACYWLFDLTLSAVGTSPGALIDGVKSILDHM